MQAKLLAIAKIVTHKIGQLCLNSIVYNFSFSLYVVRLFLHDGQRGKGDINGMSASFDV